MTWWFGTLHPCFAWSQLVSVHLLELLHFCIITYHYSYQPCFQPSHPQNLRYPKDSLCLPSDPGTPPRPSGIWIIIKGNGCALLVPVTACHSTKAGGKPLRFYKVLSWRTIKIPPHLLSAWSSTIAAKAWLQLRLHCWVFFQTHPIDSFGES